MLPWHHATMSQDRLQMWVKISRTQGLRGDSNEPDLILACQLSRPIVPNRRQTAGSYLASAEKDLGFQSVRRSSHA
jgi:hypothetical protein